MGRLKKDRIEISIGNGLGTVFIDVVYNVSSRGEFYCEVPETIVAFFSSNKIYEGQAYFGESKRTKKPTVYAPTLSALTDVLVVALRASNAPEIKEEYVIQYNIESHVTFAQDSLGNIYPNAGYPDTKWTAIGSESSDLYGGHSATHPNKGGFSLCIGAVASIRTTSKVGDKESVVYKKYYKDGNHLGRSNPAEKLNSWTGFHLPVDFKEIPYTDESALFFYNLMLGLANISKRIQEATFNQSELLELIESNSGHFLSAPTQQSAYADNMSINVDNVDDNINEAVEVNNVGTKSIDDSKRIAELEEALSSVLNLSKNFVKPALSLATTDYPLSSMANIALTDWNSLHDNCSNLLKDRK